MAEVMTRGQKIIITIAATIILAIIAFFIHDYFFEFVLSQFDDLEFVATSTDLFANRESFFTFISVIAVLPSLFLFANFVLKDENPSVFFFIIPFTLICGFGMMMFHVYSLRWELQEMHQFETDYLIVTHHITIENIHAARFLGIGFLIGAISSTAILSFIHRNNRA
jgi:hypothetical protein